VPLYQRLVLGVTLATLRPNNAITILGASVATPTFAPAAGSYSAPQTVALSCATLLSTIYYTTNGVTPTTASAVYSAPISVGATQTVKAMAMALGFAPSAVATAAYTITPSRSLSINSSGRLVNSAGTAIMLRGANLTGLNDQIAEGFGITDPWGNSNTPLDPNFINMAAWKMNVARIILNVQSFLNLTVRTLTGTTNGTAGWSAGTFASDPVGNYKAYLAAAITKARANGMYVILDCHECAPQFTLSATTAYLCAIDQSPFMDQNSCSLFWSDATQSLPVWLATNFGSAAFNTAHGYNGGAAGASYNALYGGTSGFSDIIFELFNEPYFSNQSFTLTTRAGSFGNPAWKANNGGSAYTTTNGGTPPDTPGNSGLGGYTSGQEFVALYGGFCNWFYQQNVYVNSRGIPPGFVVGSTAGALNQVWTVYGYQQALDGIRALGCTNVCLVNGQGFASTQSNLPYYMPVDSLSPPQVGTGWHAYQSGTSGYPVTLDPGSGTSACLTYSAANAAGTSGLGRAVPVIITEIGTASGGASPQPDLYIQAMTALVDARTLGSSHYVSFCHNGGGANGASTTSFADTVYGAPVAITAGISGTLLTVSAAGGTILPGMAITSGAQLGAPYILPYGSGGTTGTGGTGTYQIDNSQTVAGGTSMNVNALLPFSGQGQTYYNWTSVHA
jgi:Chitobiase/beta-hexosaminidase C-terminal domain/Cellulase (glycosyl hydrolase family 5)